VGDNNAPQTSWLDFGEGKGRVKGKVSQGGRKRRKNEGTGREIK